MKVICWKGKGLKKMHTKCHKIHKLPTEMYPVCIQAYLYMYNQKRKTRFTVSSLHESHH